MVKDVTINRPDYPQVTEKPKLHDGLAYGFRKFVPEGPYADALYDYYTGKATIFVYE